jgi:hypothetical protein
MDIQNYLPTKVISPRANALGENNVDIHLLTRPCMFWLFCLSLLFFLLPQILELFGFQIFLLFRVPNEGYPRNASYVLNLISTCLRFLNGLLDYIIIVRVERFILHVIIECNSHFLCTYRSAISY